jgi:rhodanese-related sulfurtransferase
MRTLFSAKGVTGKAEKIVNIALILMAVLFVAVMAQKVFIGNRAKAVQPVQQGMKLEISGVDWAKSDQTLVMALSKSCHYCTESGPFYQKVVARLTAAGKMRTIAVLPQTLNESEQYLKQLGVFPQEVFQISLRSIGISAAPTLLLVDKAGVIVDMWVGLLNTHRQLSLFRRLDIETNELATDSSGTTSIDVSELKRAMARKEPIVVLDVEDRDIYHVGHIPGAVNIPSDELEARANDELPQTGTIVVYCRNLELSGHAADMLVKNNGFKRVSILKGGLKQWQAHDYEKPIDKKP